MKQKLLLLILALCTTMGAWATVTQPTLTTDPSNPTYYTIKNYRSNKYAAYTGASSQLAQVESTTSATLWYFVENSDGVSIIPADDPTKKLASTTSATADGIVWYLKESHKTGYFCISKSSTDVTSGTNNTQDCWDDQGSHTKIGYWKSVSGDADGTAWIIERAKTIPTGYYYFKGLANDIERYPYLYSDFVNKGDNYTYHHTLPNSPKNGDIWKITNNGATFTVSNGEGLPVIPDNGTSYNSLTIGSSEVGPDIYFTEALNLTTWGDGSKITTWAGHPNAADNHWTFERVDVSDGVYDVVIVGHPNGYVTYNGQNAKNGGFFVAASITTEDLEPADIADYTYSKNVTDHTITITYTANVTYTLTDINGQTYSWSAIGSIGISPTITGCAGYTLSNEVWNEGSKTYTADITFPFPVSSKGVTNWTYIGSFHNKNGYNSKDFLWQASGTDVIVNDNEEPTNESGEQEKYMWTIIPAFSNGAFTFTIKHAIKNVSDKDMYIYSNAGSKSHDQGAVILSETASSLTYETGSTSNCGTVYLWKITTTNLYLSVNSATTHTDQYVGVWNTIHDGVSIAYYTLADFTTLLANLKTAYTTFGSFFTAYAPLLADGTYAETESGAMATAYANNGSVRDVVKDTPSVYLTATQFKTYTDAYNNAMDGLYFVMPTGKFIRFKNVDGTKYAKASTSLTDEVQLGFSTGGTDASSIFYLNASNNLLAYNSGSFLLAINNTCRVSYFGWKDTFEFLKGSDANQIYVHAVSVPTGWGGDNKYWSGNDETNKIDRISTPTSNSNFLIETVTSLPITMNLSGGAYYATINLPVAVEIPSGLSAYSATADGTTLSLTKVVENGVLAASQPVILYSKAPVTSLTISGESGESAGSNELLGTTAATSVTSGQNYVLGANGSGDVGFYLYNNNIMPGFKAYLSASAKSNGVKAFTFSFEDVEDAIRAIESENNGLEIYDIAGRRVQKAQKGLYIVNGKKVMYN